LVVGHRGPAFLIGNWRRCVLHRQASPRRWPRATGPLSCRLAKMKDW